MRFQTWIWIFLLGTLGLAPVAEAGEREITLTRRFGIGARAMGMGGVATALVDDGSALFLNPAGLARVRRIELAGGIKHQSFGLDAQVIAPYVGDLTEGSSIATRLGSLTGVYPLPTYRGSLVAAGGFERVFSSDMEYVYQGPAVDDSFSERESYSVTGGVLAWAVGGAIDISASASLGVTFLLWDGHDDVINNYDCFTCDPDTFDFERLIGTDYSAVSAIVGLQFRPTDWLGIGATVESPVSFTLEGTNVFYGYQTAYSYWFEDKLRLPFSFAGGGAVRMGALILGGDVRYTDWRQLDYEGILREEGQFEYRATTEVHLGAEYMVPFYPLRIRAGYYTEPLAYKALNLKEDRSFYTLGAGFLIDDVLAVDAALTLGDLEWSQDFQEREIHRDESLTRFFISTAYRF